MMGVAVDITICQIFFFAIAVVLFVFICLNFRYNKLEWPGRQKTWEASYLCKTCGNVFIPKM